jgi:hypothetical protein
MIIVIIINLIVRTAKENRAQMTLEARGLDCNIGIPNISLLVLESVKIDL